MTEITMLRALLVSTLPLLLVALPARPDESSAPEGSIALDGETRVEVLSHKVPVGQRIELPEGWYRVEEEGVEDGEVGSFTIASAAPIDAGLAPSAPASAPQAAPAPAAARSGSPAALATSALRPGEACRAERTAYLKELWRESGIEVSDPDALVRGLDAGTLGPGVAFLWSTLSMDVVRNLAWSSDLRSRAQDLIRCVNAHE